MKAPEVHEIYKSLFPTGTHTTKPAKVTMIIAHEFPKEEEEDEDEEARERVKAAALATAAAVVGGIHSRTPKAEAIEKIKKLLTGLNINPGDLAPLAEPAAAKTEGMKQIVDPFDPFEAACEAVSVSSADACFEAAPEVRQTSNVKIAEFDKRVSATHARRHMLSRLASNIASGGTDADTDEALKALGKLKALNPSTKIGSDSILSEAAVISLEIFKNNHALKSEEILSALQGNFAQMLKKPAPLTRADMLLAIFSIREVLSATAGESHVITRLFIELSTKMTDVSDWPEKAYTMVWGDMGNRISKIQDIVNVDALQGRSTLKEHINEIWAIDSIIHKGEAAAGAQAMMPAGSSRGGGSRGAGASSSPGPWRGGPPRDNAPGAYTNQGPERKVFSSLISESSGRLFAGLPSLAAKVREARITQWKDFPSVCLRHLLGEQCFSHGGGSIRATHIDKGDALKILKTFAPDFTEAELDKAISLSVRAGTARVQ